VSGKVAVLHSAGGYDKIDLVIDVVRNRPRLCRGTLRITSEFAPDEYRRGYEFSISFAQDILPQKYENEWVTNVESKLCP
jgi:hypothetical protein